jgi:hypothetical protein
MKKILIALLFFTVSASAQISTEKTETDLVEVKFIQLPDSTATGTPNGKKVSKEIEPTGGAISSADGRVELIFPANALTRTTEISIQPVTSVIPSGNKAYQFEPSGTQFIKPVLIVFHYTGEEAKICPPEFKFMALQDHKGKWKYMAYDEWDSTTKSLKGSISHFSTFVDGNQIQLSSTEITLKVGTTHLLALNIVQPHPPPAAEGEDDLPPLPSTIQRGNREALWKVNDNTGGSAKHGTITPLRGQAIKATYKAPAALTVDLITVKLELNDVMIEHIRERAGRRGWTAYNRRRISNVATFTCKVNLFDEYKVTVSQNVKEDGWQMTDTSVFRLRVGIADRASISDIYNINARVHIPPSGCRAIYVNAATCVGMINVTGLKTSNVRPSANGSVIVDIYFKQAPMIFPVINFPPCGNNRASPTTPPVVTPNAFPMWLNFEAKDEKQYISLGEGAGVVVRRPDPEDITATIEPIRE